MRFSQAIKRLLPAYITRANIRKITVISKRLGINGMVPRYRNDIAKMSYGELKNYAAFLCLPDVHFRYQFKLSTPKPP